MAVDHGGDLFFGQTAFHQRLFGHRFKIGGRGAAHIHRAVSWTATAVGAAGAVAPAAFDFLTRADRAGYQTLTVNGAFHTTNAAFTRAVPRGTLGIVERIHIEAGRILR